MGWSRAADTALLAEHYHHGGSEMLATRHRSLADTSRRAAEEFRGRLQHAKRAIEEASSGFNRGRNQVFDRLRDEARRSLHWFEDEITELEHHLRVQIDEVTSTDAARRLGSELGDAVLSRASEVWQDIRRDASDLYGSLLTDLLIEAEEDLRFTERTTPRLSAYTPKIEGDFLNRVNVAEPRDQCRVHGRRPGGGSGLGRDARATDRRPRRHRGDHMGAPQRLACFRGAPRRTRPRQAPTSTWTRSLRRADQLWAGTEVLFRSWSGACASRPITSPCGSGSEAEAELARIKDEDRMTQQQRADEARSSKVKSPNGGKLGEDSRPSVAS